MGVRIMEAEKYSNDQSEVFLIQLPTLLGSQKGMEEVALIPTEDSSKC
jgi:hypothetical protein